MTRIAASLRSTALACSFAALAVATAACGDDEADPVPGSPDAAVPAGASLRVIHGSPDAPAVDIYAAGVATPLFTDVAYGDATAYVTVPAGSYDIEVRAAGSPASSAPAFSTGPLALASGVKVSALAAGFLASTDAADAFRILPLVEDFDAPASGAARVRIVHASADAPTVAIDVGNDGTPEIEALERFADTGAAGIDLPAGQALQVGVWAGTPRERVTAFTTPELPAGAELFVIATGKLGKLPREADGFALLAVGPTAAVGFVKQNPRVYALHGSPDAPAVDVFAGAAELIDDLTFTELSAPLQVPPGAYTLDFFAHAAGQARPAGAPAASAQTPALAAGERYLAVASGFLGAAGGEETFQLLAFQDGFSLGDTTGARVQVVHGSPDAPTVDVGTADGNTVSALADFSDLSFGEASVATGTAVPAASLTIGVAAADTTAAVATFDVTTANGLRAFAVAAGALTATQTRRGFRLILVITSTTPWTSAVVQPN